MKEMKTTVAIIGGGPAGCAAAIQLKRAGIEPIIFEKSRIGGLALNANLIENYLAVEQGIDGLIFGKKMEEQVYSLVIETVFETVLKIITENNQIKIKTKNTLCLCDFVIVATGTRPNELNVKGTKEATSKNLLFYEPIDIPITKLANSNIAIIGGSDAAFDYALNFAQKDNKITIIHRSENFRCLPLLYYRASNIDAIDLVYPQELKVIKVENNKLNLILSDKSELKVDFLVGAIGRHPNDKLLNDIPEKEIGKRVFPIGDLINDNYRQISIAASDGLRTAMKIIDFIKKK